MTLEDKCFEIEKKFFQLKLIQIRKILQNLRRFSCKILEHIKVEIKLCYVIQMANQPHL